MKPLPKGWPRLSVSVFYQDAAKAIDWLCTAFGFEVRLRVDGEGGRIEHSELVFGDAVVMVGDESRAKDKVRNMVSPRSVGGMNTSGIMIYVDDVDAFCERARKAGGTITYEPKVTDYGEEYWADKSCEVEDLEGHRWWFCQRMRG
ncbi:MAG: VOC family protein [Deltaproteobacteria bacterium]|nr:VOC family protein [Deltaproteobacteria bacterium]